MSASLIAALLAAAAGASLVVQQVLNTNLRTALGSAAWSGFVSYAAGVACMAVFIVALRDPLPSVGTAARIPWWAWSGGVFGAVFVGLGIVLVPGCDLPGHAGDGADDRFRHL